VNENCTDCTEYLFDYIKLDVYDHFFLLCATAATAVARLSHRNSVRLSITWVDQSKTTQARITKSLLSATWKTLVSGSVKFFHKFEGVTPNEVRGVGKICNFQPIWHWQSEIGDDDDDDQGRINFSVALSPKTTRTRNNKFKQ